MRGKWAERRRRQDRPPGRFGASSPGSLAGAASMSFRLFWAGLGCRALGRGLAPQPSPGLAGALPLAAIAILWAVWATAAPAEAPGEATVDKSPKGKNVKAGPNAAPAAVAKDPYPIGRGLRWLARHQDLEGHWSTDPCLPH